MTSALCYAVIARWFPLYTAESVQLSEYGKSGRRAKLKRESRCLIELQA